MACIYDLDKREICIFDVIAPDADGGCGYASFDEGLRAMRGGSVTVRVNSPGGSAFEGLAIYNSMRRFNGTITTVNDGYAASIASIVMLGGHVRQTAKFTTAMIHSAWVITAGDHHELRDMANHLEGTSDQLADIYAERLKGVSRSQVVDWMNRETWWDSDQQLKHGFVHSLIGNTKTATQSKAIDAALVTLSMRKAKHQVDCQLANYRDRMEAKWRSRTNEQVAKKAVAKSLFPLRVAAELALLKRKLDARKR